MDRNLCKGVTVKAPEAEKQVLTNGEAQRLSMREGPVAIGSILLGR